MTAAVLLTLVWRLSAHQLVNDFQFLFSRAGFDLSEGMTLTVGGSDIGLGAFGRELANWQALSAGLFNTLKVILVALLSATIIGTAVGATLLSRNFLLRTLSRSYVELIRNTPLLVQLVFWYFGVILGFPPVAKAVNLYGWLIVSQHGVNFPAIGVRDGVWQFASLGAALLVLALWAAVWRPLRRFPAVAICMAAAGLAVFIVGRPLQVSWPVIGQFSISGGSGVSPEFAAMLLALVVFSAAYIAEIIRGVILSVPRGQSEAAAALGLSNGQTMRDVILPQVYRVVLPALSNQYVSLAKNTSLGIAIGYPDLFNVAGTIANQTGRDFECIILVMVAYLLVSWGISGATAALNAALARRG